MNTKKTYDDFEPRPGAERRKKFAQIVTWMVIAGLVLSIAIPALVSAFI